MTMKFMLSVNRHATGKIPPGDPLWAKFNDDFVPADLAVTEIANEIYTGHAYAAVHQGRRSLENFVAAQHIAIDMDSGDERSSFDALMEHDLVKMYGGIIHTTPSHTDDSPRARVIFFLDEPITDKEGFTAAAKFLISQFDGSDPACTDASRFFYGAKNCRLEFWHNVLPKRQLRYYYRRWASQEKAPGRRDGIIRLESYRNAANVDSSGVYGDSEPHYAAPDNREPRFSLDALLNPVRNATNGNRNNALNRQAFLAGKDVRAGKIGESEVVEHLLRAALAVGLDEREALRTIRSGMSGAAKAV